MILSEQFTERDSTKTALSYSVGGIPVTVAVRYGGEI